MDFYLYKNRSLPLSSSFYGTPLHLSAAEVWASPRAQLRKLAVPEAVYVSIKYHWQCYFDPRALRKHQVGAARAMVTTTTC